MNCQKRTLILCGAMIAILITCLPIQETLLAAQTKNSNAKKLTESSPLSGLEYRFVGALGLFGLAVQKRKIFVDILAHTPSRRGIRPGTTVIGPKGRPCQRPSRVLSLCRSKPQAPEGEKLETPGRLRRNRLAGQSSGGSPSPGARCQLASARQRQGGIGRISRGACSLGRIFRSRRDQRR